MGRSPCCDDVSGLKKGPWTPEEDELLTSYIEKHGLGSWRALPKAAALKRCGKSCRLRWTNYLRPDIKRGRFTEEEEDMIIKLHSILGNKWSRIAAHLPGRTDNEIKNYWNTHLRKRLLQMGIDPVTHKPRSDLNILANISQLFTTNTPQNIGALIMNNSLRLQPNVAEIAKLQVLQNILQILNNSLPNNMNAAGNMNGNNSCSTSSHGYNHVPYDVVNPSHAISEKYAFPSFDTTYNTNNTYNNNNNNNSNNNNDKSSLSSSYEALDEGKLPSLIETESSNTNSTNNASSPYTPLNAHFFEGFENLLDDGNTDFWKQFIK